MTSNNPVPASPKRNKTQAVGTAGISSAAEATDRKNVKAPPVRAGRVPPRSRDSFDFSWKFCKGDVPGAQQPDFVDGNWQDIDLPHDWSIEGPFDENAPAGGSGGYLPTGIGWYRKHFNIPESYQEKKVSIEFDGVYQLSEVWINGQYLGKRPFGYISFYYDLTPYLKFGGENMIAVKVDNSRQPNCRWYSGSGIYRHTWLLVTNKVHVAQWGTFVTTPQVDMGAAVVQIKTRVQNEGANAAECRITNTILDRDGNPVVGAQVSESASIAPNGEYEFVQQIRVVEPHLWSTENPYLYKMRTFVMSQTSDAYDTAFGIRKIEFDVDRGFLLNGKQVRLNGVCLHHDGGPVGAAVPDRVWERRLEILKAMGCNSIRTSHNPYSPEFMDMCDRLGFMVMNEVFDEWKQNKTPAGYGNYYDEWSKLDVTNFVHRDRNHPSVLLWSAGNEIGEQVATEGPEMLKKLIEIFHGEDPTRPVTMGCDRIAANLTGREIGAPPEFLELLDVVGYNYSDRRNKRAETNYSDDRHAYPNRKFIGTENGSMGGIRGDYSELVPESNTAAPRRRHNRGLDFEQLWKFRRVYEYVSGDHMWTGIDHIGESPAWPAKGSGAGVLDTCGFPKDGYYFCQSQWTDKPMIYAFPHWNWKGKEGDIIPVLCYTNCDTVELFVNGKSYGVQGYWFPRVGYWPPQGEAATRSAAPRTTSDLHLTWTVPYVPGTLKFVGTKDGKVVVTEEITTTGEPAGITLSMDRSSIAADRRDVTHITVRIIDAQGKIVPTAGNEVTFEIQGEGKLIGVDSGNLRSSEDYKSNRRKVFNGLCLAIVQSTAKSGQIQITATSPGLKSCSVTVTTNETQG